MPFDVASVRGLFPALGDGWIHFDAQAGQQLPDSVTIAMSAGARALAVDPRGVSPQAVAAADAEQTARRSVADLLCADAAGVVFGPSRSVLVTALVDALPVTSWGGETVLSRLDDEDNIVPWLRGARRHGSGIRWAEIDVTEGTLPVDQYTGLIGQRTSVVAVTLASGATGAIVDVAQIASRARSVGALVVVDASSAAPYARLSIDELGADVVLLSPARWGGPRMAVMVFAEQSRIQGLNRVSMDPLTTGPARLEAEPMPGPLLTGLVASIEHLADLDGAASGKRRQRLATSMEGIFEYGQRMTQYLVNSLEQLGRVRVIGPQVHRIPAVSFVVDGVPAEKVCRRLADNGISALHGLPSRALVALGADDVGGAVTVGLGPYAIPYEVDQLVRVLGSFG
ncbi:MAG: aminotransferase class V-fold PLP-dependent enzyme [Gordonia sp. (in: high G+C Gram-positive bacteria)]|uniref:aminotransferase class V-fold PLP-dependent enzyme n=1 Tax=Gordonia sp. (in: high G+C Gram-positive bacteria) TaxID=84139 RepID=UPI003BB63EDF